VNSLPSESVVPVAKRPRISDGAGVQNEMLDEEAQQKYYDRLVYLLIPYEYKAASSVEERYNILVNLKDFPKSMIDVCADKIFQNMAYKGYCELVQYMVDTYPEIKRSNFFLDYNNFRCVQCGCDERTLRLLLQYRQFDMTPTILQELLSSCFKSELVCPGSSQLTKSLKSSCFQYLISSFSDLVPSLPGVEIWILDKFFDPLLQLNSDVIASFKLFVDAATSGDNVPSVELVYDFTRQFKISSAYHVEFFKVFISDNFLKMIPMYNPRAKRNKFHTFILNLINEICLDTEFVCTIYHTQALQHALEYVRTTQYDTLVYGMQLITMCRYTNKIDRNHAEYIWHRYQFWSVMGQFLAVVMGNESFEDVVIRVTWDGQPLHGVSALLKFKQFAQHYIQIRLQSIKTTTGLCSDVVDHILNEY